MSTNDRPPNPKPPKFLNSSRIITQPNCDVDSEAFKEYWHKKLNSLRDRFDELFCMRTPSPEGRPIAMRLLREYCESMKELERDFAGMGATGMGATGIHCRIAALHSILTAINIIQEDLFESQRGL